MRRLIIMVLLAVCLFSGCRSGSRTKIGRQKAPSSGLISKMELRDELDRFEYSFITSVKQTAGDINAASSTARTKRNSYQTRIRMLEAIYAMNASDDPVVVFMDTWGLIIRLRLYLEEGDGSALYGQQQPIALNFIHQAEEDIINIGQLFLKPEQFEQVQAGLETFAQAHPITGTYSNLVVYATQIEEKEVGLFLKTLSIPMAPIRAMEGVDNTATAIHRVRDSVDHFTNVAQQFPESARWQTSILMDDFEESEMTKSFLASLDQFSQSSAQLVGILEAMPAQLRDELLTVLEESDQTQQQLQKTMQTAEQTAVQLEQTLGELQKATTTVNDTAAQATETAVAWEKASNAIQDLVMLFKTKNPRSPDDPPPFGMHDFNTMLTNAGQTADKVTQTVAQLQTAIDSGTKTGIPQEMRSLVDHIVWRLFQLVLAVFGLMLIFILIKRKVTTR